MKILLKLYIITVYTYYMISLWKSALLTVKQHYFFSIWNSSKKSDQKEMKDQGKWWLGSSLLMLWSLTTAAQASSNWKEDPGEPKEIFLNVLNSVSEIEYYALRWNQNLI